MPKGGPEVGNTVPIKNQQGEITGWTDPENAAKLGISTDPGFALDGQFTGYTDDNSAAVMIDPATGKTVTKMVGDDIFQYNPRGDETNWAYDAAGNRILMDTSTEGWEEFGAFNPELEGFQLGYVPEEPVYNPGDGLVLGPGAGGTTPPVTQPPVTQPPVEPPREIPPTETPLPPVLNEPTDDWNPIDWDEYVGYEDVPLPDGDGSFDKWHGKNKQRDTSWNWDFFRDKQPGDRQWGGYDTDYQAFERYQPGMDSPWGMPNIKGGNEDFYQQQFVNQLRDEQSFRSRQRESQKARAQMLREKPDDITTDEMWEWAYGGQGIPGVKVGTGEAAPVGWDLNNRFNNESTIGEILNWGSNNDAFTNDQKKFFAQHRKNVANTGGNLDSTAWARAGDPNVLIGRIQGEEAGGFNNVNIRNMTDLFNTLYNQSQAGPYAPAGYANPIQWGGSYPGATTQ